MISVIIPTLDAEATLTATFAALVPAVVEGLVREVIVVDGGSRDATIRIADGCGATILTGERGRGQQLAAGAKAARQPWLLFLHADTQLSAGWEREAGAFIDREDRRDAPRAAAFRFALDDVGFAPRLLEGAVRLRSGLMKLPYGDQGLLIARRHYDALGGFPHIPIMEDVALVRRIGWRRLVLLRSEAVTSAERYRRDGYVARVARNLTCLTLHFLGLPAERIAKLYSPASNS